MKHMQKVAPVLLAIGLWAAAGDTARAQVGGAPAALGYGFFGSGLYGPVNAESPPFYAIYPPVYYSHPVPRAYGYSPYAYPPGYVTPVVQPLPPKEVANPYVPRQRKAATADRTAAAPQVLMNPFVAERRRAELASRSFAER
jgi:hypothetical protein